jgi:hypothetical protein
MHYVYKKLLTNSCIVFSVIVILVLAIARYCQCHHYYSHVGCKYATSFARYQVEVWPVQIT